MKKLIILLSLALASCQWLDVKPSGESNDTQTFSSQKGFVQVLNGAYIRMKDNRIYGRRLSYTDIEFLCQHWLNNGGVQLWTDLRAYNYNNATVAGNMSQAYEYLYKVVAEVNGLLENIDGKRDIFDAGYYEIIKGEALALRAYCHLDVLRLFGPMPTAAEQDKVILPYVTTISRLPNQWSTFAQFNTALREDLKEAERLLADVDPILDYTMQELNPTTVEGQTWLDTNLGDQWLYARQLRLNYYAVLALRARAELWAGNNAEAASYAKMVINAKSANGQSQFRLGGDADFNAGDYALSCEHLFALEDPRLADVHNDIFIRPNQPALALLIYYPLGKFRSPGTDIRATRLWVQKPDYNGYIQKYMMRSIDPIYQLPLIRLSEMYFIAAEGSGASAGKPFMDDFFTARNIPAQNYATDAALQTDVVKEYWREFWGEGQSFYALKRTASPANVMEYWNTTPTIDKIYVVPMPQNEINY